MRVKEIQVEGAEKDVSRHPEQELQISLGGGPAREVHKAEIATISPDVGARQGGHRATGKDARHEPAAGSDTILRLAPMGPMTASGMESDVLQLLVKVLQPQSIADGMVGDGNLAADHSLRQRLIAFLGRLAVSAEPSAASFIGAPAKAAEAESAPDLATPAESDQRSTGPAPTPRKWKWCPDPAPYVNEATLQNPLSDLDLRDSISVKTGYAPSLPALQNRLWKLAEEGKIETYVHNHRGDMIPYRARRSKFKLYVVCTDAVNRTSQPAPLLPKPTETSPGPGDEGPIAEGTQDGLAPPSSAAVTLDAAPDPVPEAAMHVEPPHPGDLAGWLRQFGGKKISIEIEF